MTANDIIIFAILGVLLVGACVFVFKNNLHMAKCSGCCEGCPNQCGKKQEK